MVLVGWLGKPVLGGSALVKWVVGWIGAGWAEVSIATVRWTRAGWVVSAVVGWKTAGWVIVAAVSLAVRWMVAGGWLTVVSAVSWVGVVGMFSGARLVI